MTLLPYLFNYGKSESDTHAQENYKILSKWILHLVTSLININKSISRHMVRVACSPETECIMHLSMCCSTTPLGLNWGFGRGFDTKISSHYGAFDISKRRPTIWGIWLLFKKFSSRQIPTQVPTLHLGFTWEFDLLDLPHYGAFDILMCQIPTIAPYKPEGRGVVGLYTLIGALQQYKSFDTTIRLKFGTLVCHPTAIITCSTNFGENSCKTCELMNSHIFIPTR